jgi:uncharacterized protein YecE (DUF72 family)
MIMSDPGVIEIGRTSPPADPVEGGCQVFVGTSGYSYTEWVDGGFYPAGTKTADMLPLYARVFSIVELNYTWYQMARAEAVARLVAKAPEHFRFAAKLTRTLTHEREENWREQLRLYRAGIEPLRRRLAAVLIQLPPDFARTTSNRRYLAELLDGLEGLPIAVEFRHVSWAVDPVFAELSRRRVTLVTVDVPGLPGLFPPLDVITNPELFYVRFHGRNLAGWRTANMQKKFDYRYCSAELLEWATTRLRVLSSQAGKGIIFFNNHVRAQAPANALELLKIIGEGV